jgi:hypothetical protein
VLLKLQLLWENEEQGVGKEQRSQENEEHTLCKKLKSETQIEDMSVSARIGSNSVEDKRRRSTFRRVSIKLISESNAGWERAAQSGE